MALFHRIDLAWGLGGRRPPNETGLCALDETGCILDAGWTRGPGAVDEWVGTMLAQHRAAGETVVIAIDAPLIVPNETGMRACERDVGRCYGRWKVGANASNRALASRAGEALLDLLEQRGVAYTDGTTPAAPGAAVAFECYPYTTLVGVDAFGYDDERPRYKRLDRSIASSEAKIRRAAATDELILRLDRLAEADADPRLDVRSHAVTAEIAATLTPPSGEKSRKHREDLIDAALCAYTAAFWHRHGSPRTQALGTLDPATVDRDARGRVASIVAPARRTARASQWRAHWGAARPVDSSSRHEHPSTSTVEA